ncbi:FAD-linked sulfhydryl oxidase ERV1 isoform X2 [Beta vulgaris subsp. vulgaris]|uniref:FAD-linked sulfhydryl oxidase ERV1 isoform X2 n=1 Tax=Beta vulgaris subsp. vulgaris TaxID=3555 RepID=UPI002036BB87|nr:FAD-linked sulfhydryl oxidase ERV1 isoform X2 [Beta vulgaris subsp. vulgaris]
MSENPFQPIFQTFQRISNCIQSQLSSLTGLTIHAPHPNEKPLLFLSSYSKPTDVSTKGTTSQPVTKEELGRSTWTFLHTLAAQMAILSRMYPCKECADHFKEVLRANPVQAGSQVEFSQWLCHVHNVVNRRWNIALEKCSLKSMFCPYFLLLFNSLGKTIFPCERVDARWGKLDCEKRMCDLQGTNTFGDDIL